MKILLIGPLPPPVTGHSLAVKVFLEELSKVYPVESINLSKDSFTNGVNSFNRIRQVLSILGQVWVKKENASCIYLTISESVAGNIKDLFIYLLCLRRLSRMVIHLHGGSIKKLLFEKHRILFGINKFFLKRLGGLIVLGGSHVEIFSGLIDEGKIHIVPNFAEDYMFVTKDEIDRKFSETTPLRILFVSNLIEGKGYDELVDAFFALDEDVKKKVRLDFAGAFESEMQKSAFLTRINGTGGIKYHGIVSGERKKQLFSNAHVFCLPTSLNEGQPIAILEAYASGCVVVTTNQGGIGDVFKNGINGFEINKKSVDSITGVIEQIIEHPKSLLQIAELNRDIAYDTYRSDNYNTALIRIIEELDSCSKNQ